MAARMAREDGNDCILEHIGAIGAVKVLLGEGLELHPSHVQLLQVAQRLGNPFLTEAV